MNLGVVDRVARHELIRSVGVDGIRCVRCADARGVSMKVIGMTLLMSACAAVPGNSGRRSRRFRCRGVCMSCGVGIVTFVDPDLRAFLIRHYPPVDDKPGSTDQDRPHWLLGTGDVIPRFYGTPVGIRFELSGIMGTWSEELGRERNDYELAKCIEQATKRSTALFEAAFPEFEDGWFIGRASVAQTMRQRIGRFRLPSRRAALNHLDSFVPVEARSKLVIDVVPNWRNEDSEDDQPLLEASLSIAPRSMSWQPVLAERSAAELGGVDLGWETYFVSRVSGIVFHMYDDRGLDIIAPDAAAIRPIYTNFDDWVLDYDRERIDAVFT